MNLDMGYDASKSHLSLEPKIMTVSSRQVAFLSHVTMVTEGPLESPNGKHIDISLKNV